MEIRDYAPGDEKKILDLFHITFGKPMKETYWKWRFLDNPLNKKMIKLMWDGENLAGHYAVSPININVSGQRILAALSMTTMTSPKYAGKGIFTDLASILYNDELKRNNLKAVFGYPNNNSHYAFIKNLKWLNLESVPTLSLKITDFKKIEFTNIKIVDSFSLAHESSTQEITKDFEFKIEKTKAYLEWRYKANPANKYDIFEFEDVNKKYFAVTKIFPSFGIDNKFEIDIVELNFPPDFDLLLKLINSIKQHYSAKSVTKINTWLPLHDLKHILLEKIGFQNDVPITYSAIKILDNKYKHLTNVRDWHYAMGDSDIY